MTADMTPWQRLTTALSLLAIDPKGLGGLTIRARVGPARGAAMEHATQVFERRIRLHPRMTRDDLEGGVDLTATLSSGVLTQSKGLLAGPQSALILPMAERVEPQLATYLGAMLDATPGHCLIALDEGADVDEAVPKGLADRLAMQVDLDEMARSDISAAPAIDIPARRANLGRVEMPDDLPEQLVVLAVKLGISSLRAPSFALRAAKAHAAFSGRVRVESDDVAAAAALVYAHRATQLPADEEPQEAPPEPQEQADAETGQEENLQVPDELLLEAIKTALPADLLTQLSGGSGKKGSGSGSGKRKIGNRRGRPLPARGNRAKSGARIDLMATLRAAIPWQNLRKQAQPGRVGAIIRPEDLRAKRYEELSDRLLIFTVDASGSAALARLGEAKGAIELLLAEAYARRDHVALIAFRGAEAELLLPPTRSLVQTKRRLAALPGGGGTPTAAGLAEALKLAQSSGGKGLTPTVILLTDGRSNVALDGSANRAQAGQDAQDMAQALRSNGVDSLVIDTGNRPAAALAELALRMDAPYIALPRADARKLSDTVTATLDA